MGIDLAGMRYQVERYGAASAAESHPDLLDSDPILKHALMQLKTAEYTLRKRLEDLIDAWEGQND